MDRDQVYTVLRALASPIVAVTCCWRGRSNGLITNSVVRASLLPATPRIAVILSKQNYSHDLIWKAGKFAAHPLHKGQMDLVWKLGFSSGRHRDKLSDVSYHAGVPGSPILEDAYAYLDCQVVNAMDGGSYTVFLADIVDGARLTGDEIMTSEFFRATMPAEWIPLYNQLTLEAQTFAEKHIRKIRTYKWNVPVKHRRY